MLGQFDGGVLHLSSRGDRAGNTLKQARPIQLRAIATTIQDWIGGGDRFDFYQFRLAGHSRLTLSLTGLSANADLALMNRAGRVMQRSARWGRTPESIQHTLQPGVYYIRVTASAGGLQHGRTWYRQTHYRLTAAIAALDVDAPRRSEHPIAPDPLPIPLPTPAPESSPLAIPTSPENSFDIQFDYRFDSHQWFTSDRKQVLEAAATLWENSIQDEFETIDVGTRLNVVNPQTGIEVQFETDTEIDDLVVFVGVRPFDGAGGTVASGGPSGLWTAGSPLETRYRGSKFEPWTASIGFDMAEAWFFDLTPETVADLPIDQLDFWSIALHELGHALGIGASRAFDQLIHDGNFIGSHAQSRHSGNPIPLTLDGHVQDGFLASGVGSEALMDPTLQIGSRKQPTLLDMAFLQDIGYSLRLQ